MEFTIEQKSKISIQGPQLHLNIKKKFHDELKKKKLLGKDLQVTITFSDVLDAS